MLILSSSVSVKPQECVRLIRKRLKRHLNTCIGWAIIFASSHKSESFSGPRKPGKPGIPSGTNVSPAVALISLIFRKRLSYRTCFIAPFLSRRPSWIYLRGRRVKWKWSGFVHECISPVFDDGAPNIPQRRSRRGMNLGKFMDVFQRPQTINKIT